MSKYETLDKMYGFLILIKNSKYQITTKTVIDQTGVTYDLALRSLKNAHRAGILEKKKSKSSSWDYDTYTFIGTKIHQPANMLERCWKVLTTIENYHQPFTVQSMAKILNMNQVTTYHHISVVSLFLPIMELSEGGYKSGINGNTPVVYQTIKETYQ